MLLKWIVCEVSPESRQAFSQAQQQWQRIRYAEGLIAQIGGFDAAADNTACIAALWRDEACYQQFMATLHDAVSDDSDQAAHYQSSQTTRYRVVSRMPGQQPDLANALTQGKLLRVAECDVKTGHHPAFVRAQLDVWTPGMATQDGMLGGLFARQPDSGRFIVLTSWRDEEAHQHYADNQLPKLRQQAPPNVVLDGLLGRRIQLDPAWAIAGFSG